MHAQTHVHTHAYAHTFRKGRVHPSILPARPPGEAWAVALAVGGWRRSFLGSVLLLQFVHLRSDFGV